MTIHILKNSEDTFIDNGVVNGNFGSGTSFAVGKGYDGHKRRGLIRFSLESLSPGIIIVNSAKVSLMCKSETYTADSLVTFYRSLVRWYEGTQWWHSPGEEDGSTWQMRNANILAQLYWEGGIGTGGVSGDDWYATKTDDESITIPAIRFEWDVKADIEDFLDGTHENYGWFILGAEGTNNSRKDFYSNESETEDYRPILTLDLDYSQGTIPAGVTDCCDGSNYLLMERKGIVI